jgi:hypothetical protein
MDYRLSKSLVPSLALKGDWPFHSTVTGRQDTMTAAKAAIAKWNGKPTHLVLPIRDSLTVPALGLFQSRKDGRAERPAGPFREAALRS